MTKPNQKMAIGKSKGETVKVICERHNILFDRTMASRYNEGLRTDMWGVISSDGPLYIHFYEGKIDQWDYMEFLDAFYTKYPEMADMIFM